MNIETGINQKELQRWKDLHQGTKDPYIQMGIDWMDGKIEIKEFNGIKLTPKQRLFVNDKSSEILVSGGYRCGKTVGLAIKLWLLCMWFPGNQILLGRKARSDLDSTTIPTLFEFFPSGTYEYKVGPGIIYFPNGSQIHCRGLDTSVSGDDTKKASQKIKGMTLGGVALDQLEEIDFSMYEQVSGRLTYRIPYRPIFGTTNPANFWAYDYFKANPRKGTHLIETGMEDNRENLPEGFIESQMSKPKSYVDRFVKGVWDPTLIEEGRVFPEDFINQSWVKAPIKELNGIRIYEEPRNTRYQLGIDPSTGDGDPCYMCMVDVESGKQVASFHALVPVQAQIEAAHRMCVYYSLHSDVLAIPEVNGVGQAFIEGFKRFWGNIYTREVFSKRDQKRTDKLGWYTSFANKAQLISSMQKLMTYGFPKISDRDAISEFQMFVYTNEAKKYGASCPNPYHDDCVMGTMLAYLNVEPKSFTQEDEEEFCLYGDSY
jgi:hypothetical protein